MNYEEWIKTEKRTLVKMIEVDLDNTTELEDMVNDGWILRGAVVSSPKGNCLVQMVVKDVEIETVLTEEVYNELSKGFVLWDDRDLNSKGYAKRKVWNGVLE